MVKSEAIYEKLYNQPSSDDDTGLSYPHPINNDDDIIDIIESPYANDITNDNNENVCKYTLDTLLVEVDNLNYRDIESFIDNNAPTRKILKLQRHAARANIDMTHHIEQRYKDLINHNRFMCSVSIAISCALSGIISMILYLYTDASIFLAFFITFVIICVAAYTIMYCTKCRMVQQRDNV